MEAIQPLSDRRITRKGMEVEVSAKTDEEAIADGSHTLTTRQSKIIIALTIVIERWYRYG